MPIIALIIAIILIVLFAGLAYWAIGKVCGAWGIDARITITLQVLVVLLIVALVIQNQGLIAARI